jgi:hypothetical protein
MKYKITTTKKSIKKSKFKNIKQNRIYLIFLRNNLKVFNRLPQQYKLQYHKNVLLPSPLKKIPLISVLIFLSIKIINKLSNRIKRIKSTLGDNCIKHTKEHLYLHPKYQLNHMLFIKSSRKDLKIVVRY